MDIYINGLGIISRCAQSTEDLLTAVKGKRTEVQESGRIPFQMKVPPSRVRRCPRYTKMAVSCAASAFEDAEIQNAEETGTILSTGFGAAESNIAFADSVVKGDPALCSPSVFSFTVPNSCVGQICMVNGCRGFSTILTAGDPLEYSSLLLHSGRAKSILCGAVEEYNEELEAAWKASEIPADTAISEGAAMLVLSAEMTEHTYCRISGFASASLPQDPYLSKVDDGKAREALEEALSDLAVIKKPDIILTQRNGSYFDRMETAALERCFGSEVILAAPKTLFGETLGCGYLLNAALGAAMLKGQAWPLESAGGITEGKEIGTILAAGTDRHGNYLAVLLESAGTDCK